jgi:6-phosphogluconolactonase/glucosamine-6-phosphate isomerase/deaminase
MKTQREVFNKLFKEDKTELSAEKIELRLVDDFKNVLKDAQNVEKNSKKNISEASSINKDAVKLFQKAEKLDNTVSKLEKEAENLWNEFKKASNELGIDAKNTSTFKIYNDILEQLLLSSRSQDVKSVLTMRLK